MSTPEDRLRELLHSHAETVVPRGDGLAQIQERVQQRPVRRWLLPSTGAAVAAGLVLVLVAQLSGSGARESVVSPAGPGLSPAVSPTPVPGASPTAPAAPAFAGPAIWPFRSQAQADAWRTDPGTKAWAGDPVQTTQRFLADYLRVSGVVASVPRSFAAPPPGRFTVQLDSAEGSAGRVELAQYGDGGPWTVVSVGGTDLTVTTPRPDGRVTSPQRVSGRVTGVDESVRVELVTFSGVVVATAYAPAGSEVPWETTISWTTRGWTTGAVVATTRSFKDGSVTRITALPVLPG